MAVSWSQDPFYIPCLKKAPPTDPRLTSRWAKEMPKSFSESAMITTKPTAEPEERPEVTMALE